MLPQDEKSVSELILQIMSEAELSILLMSGSGLGAVLLAIVVIAGIFSWQGGASRLAGIVQSWIDRDDK